MFGDFALSWIRTAVPLAVGVAVTWLATNTGVVLDDNTSAMASALAVGVVTAVYYAVVRKLEQSWPAFGVLLGAVTQPAYGGEPASGLEYDGEAYADHDPESPVKPARRRPDFDQQDGDDL